jgi:hypothetical protein
MNFQKLVRNKKSKTQSQKGKNLKMKKLILNPEIFSDPDMVGESEYFAIYEILSSTVEEADDKGAPQDETEDLLRGILKEFILNATQMLDDLKTQPALVEEKED